MGWIRLRNQSAANKFPTGRLPDLTATHDKVLPQSDHVENIDSSSAPVSDLQDRFQQLSIPDSDLPYIDKSRVSRIRERWRSQLEDPFNVSRAWIVIDNIIYDCTEFQHEHPGGVSVIQNFIGQDCTWQFWRFHSMEHMEEFGKKLRVGRTSGVENRFKEPPRYVGLSSLDDNW